MAEDSKTFYGIALCRFLSHSLSLYSVCVCVFFCRRVWFKTFCVRCSSTVVVAQLMNSFSDVKVELKREFSCHEAVHFTRPEAQEWKWKTNMRESTAHTIDLVRICQEACVYLVLFFASRSSYCVHTHTKYRKKATKSFVRARLSRAFALILYGLTVELLYGTYSCLFRLSNSFCSAIYMGGKFAHKMDSKWKIATTQRQLSEYSRLGNSARP